MHLTAFFDVALRTLESGGNSIPALWSDFSRLAAALALTAIWQGAAVALGMAFCLRFAPRSPARHRFTLWAAGFGVVVALQVMPFISQLMPVPFHRIGTSVAPVGAATISHPWLQLGAAWSLVIAALWVVASLYRAADLIVHSLHLRRLWMSAVPIEINPASLPRSLGRLSRPAIQICTTAELERPSVIGFFAPRILIPDWLFLRLTPGELDQIVLHETEHLRRRDDWTNLLQKLCLVLFPLNPGLAWIERRLCREREMACDDGVIGITRAPRAYAACLASLAERGLQRRAGMLSLGAWQARPELVRRVHSILRRKHALSPLAARAVLGAVGCVLLAGATALARCPRLVAFAPAHSIRANRIASAEPLDAPSPISTVEPLSAPGESGIASNMQHSSAAGVASHGFASRDYAALKGHGFRRAGNSVKPLEASAPEQAASGAATQAGTHLPARAFAYTSSRRNAVSSEAGRFNAENAALRPGRGAGTEKRSDSAFVVMSTWESFEVAAPDACPKEAENRADECIAPVRIFGPASGLAAQRISPRISFTRMYVKIYSAGDKGSTWLVIQL